MKTDKELQEDVMDEIKWDPALSASAIGVSVKNGVVTLNGYVDAYAKKFAAENAAKRVKGVQAVTEKIEVHFGKGTKRTDTDIAAAALDAIKWHSNVPDDQLKLKVENGWLTLEGTVDWQYQKNAAMDAVKDLAGVKGVSNLIFLAPKTNVTKIETDIINALKRSATIEASNIEVEIRGNKVILKGKVRSWSERRDVENAVWSSPGVIEIEDNMFIGV
ncbi:MAG: ornithine aminotransferase [Bacteroidetes bacterium 43-93]|nr:BON domain-containing protein [Bacteroidota bacterium]OJX01293.1 MAG: ornithine aminotransferase [Bacteroidetes bacterium 43-93]